MKAEKIIKQFPVNYDLQWTYGGSLLKITTIGNESHRRT